MSNRDKKVVIIGLDGANSTTAKFLGVNTQIHDFISTIPPYTPPSWTSIFTGVHPAKHGVIGWQKVKVKENKVTLATSRDVKYPRLSEILSRANLKSVLINLPLTYPFDGIKYRDNMTIVSDWAAPKQAVFPSTLEDKYREYLIEPPHEWWLKGNKEDYPKIVKEFTEKRIEMYYDLFDRQDWNLYFIVFSETDWFFHMFPQVLEGKDINLVKPTFKIIKEFIEHAQSVADVSFIVSDHGFEKKNKVFYVNEALAENGFLQYSKTKTRVFTFIEKKIPRKILGKLVEITGASSSPVTYVTQNAEAFMVEAGTWGVYVKHPNKISDVKEALAKYDEIADVFEVKELYKGLYTGSMPNLIVAPQKGVEFSRELKGCTIEEANKGDHEIHGVFSVTGDAIKEDIQFNRHPRVYDVVPTILHIFGLPIPSDTDGRVLTEIFEENSEFSLKKPVFMPRINLNKR